LETSDSDVFMLSVSVATVDPATGYAAIPTSATNTASSGMTNAGLGARNQRVTAGRTLSPPFNRGEA
jgi:hypothetical protein